MLGCWKGPFCPYIYSDGEMGNTSEWHICNLFTLKEWHICNTSYPSAIYVMPVSGIYDMCDWIYGKYMAHHKTPQFTTLTWVVAAWWIAGHGDLFTDNIWPLINIAFVNWWWRGAFHTPVVLATSLRWRHNEHDGVSNHQPHHCLLNRLFRRRSKKTPKLSVTGLCAGKSPVPGEFPVQMASNAENVSIWWRHHMSHPTQTQNTVVYCAKGITYRPFDIPNAQSCMAWLLWNRYTKYYRKWKLMIQVSANLDKCLGILWYDLGLWSASYIVANRGLHAIGISYPATSMLL